MNRFSTLFALLAMAVGLHPVQATTYEVKIGDATSNSYAPAALTIRAGDAVKFTWVSGTHPTASDSQPAAWTTFTLGSANPTTTVTFNQAGSFPYHCTLHASALGNGTYVGMTGQITVQAALATTLGQGTQPALNVYPNPARGQITLQVSGTTAPDCQVRLSNVLGSEVRRFALRPDLQASTTGITLDLNGVPPGLYFCSLLSGEKTLATKRLTVL